ncbi:FG-GAP-like repeat-containing protein [Sedimentisphaera salicampi]|uniref:Esterase, PHB depolymerase family n=1 Tax=Sedimentisphaera salicampi TaxID=1941349 RepID=A0A1W6LML8_9BACT|nr:FG-GAP-like repeat-containing protein [Sedimentisphaera salicampi]ARN57017.1 esterase, PHB depolymerase family [Sedimentisphaera salicampi]
MAVFDTFRAGMIASAIFAGIVCIDSVLSARSSSAGVRLFSRIDANTDGKLSSEELDDYPRLKRILIKADSDGSGDLTIEELKGFSRTNRTSEPEENKPASRDQIKELTVNGKERRYLVHFPEGYDKDAPAPLVLAFHGGGGNPRSMIRLSGLNSKADEEGFIVVYPYGSGVMEDRFLTFNGGNCCAYAKNNGIDDVAFVEAILEDIQAHAAVDQRRIYATGMSNGAIMSYYLASELAGKIAAIAPVAGPMGTQECTPSEPVSVIHFHGTGDENAPFEGGYGKKSIRKKDAAPFHSVEHSINCWIEANQCRNGPAVTNLPDRAEDGMKSIKKVWDDGKNGSEVVLVEIKGGGHTWPGRPPTTAILGDSTMDISANDMMWEFFKKHPKPEKEEKNAASKTAGEPKVMPDTDASRDARGRGKMFESVHVPGLTDFPEGTNGIAFADFDGNGYLDALTVTTPPFILAEEMKGRENPRDTLRLMMNYGSFEFRSEEITLNGSPAKPDDFGQGWRGSQVPVAADFNNDGLLDFFVSRQFPGMGNKRRKGHKAVGCSLFLAEGSYNTFKDVSEKLNVLNERAYNRQPSLGDVNQDGWIDIAVGADNTTNAFEGISKAALFVYRPEDGDFASGRYEDIGGSDLAPDFGGFYNNPQKDKAGPKVSLRDIDNDGDLDLFQSTHVLINIHYNARNLPLSPAEYRQGVFTWRNMLAETGELRFEKSVDNGMAGEARLKYDKQKQIYVPENAETAPGLAYLFFADINNDSFLDAAAVDGTDFLYTPKTEDTAACLWLNEEGFSFRKASGETSFDALNHSYRYWYQFFENEITKKLKFTIPRGKMNKSQPGLSRKAPLDFRPYYGDLVFADFNNDTFIDFVAIDRREAKLLEPRAILFLNQNGESFEPQPTTFSGIDSTGIAGEAADLNNDGLVDLFISGDPDNTAPEGNPRHRYEDKVYLNTGARNSKDNHWLRLRFSGISHAALIGTRIELFEPENGERIGTRGIYAEHSYKSGSPLEAHFGLGENELAEVRVFLPSGEKFTLREVKADQYLDLNVSSRSLEPVKVENKAETAS